MTTKRKVLLVIIAIALIPAVCFMIIVSPWILLAVGSWLSSSPPKPEIKYGEFPISVTYQIDNEIKTINDVVICEYVGTKNLGTAGKHREWKEQLKSGKEMVTLLDLRSKEYFTEWGTQVLELCLDPGSAEYYLGEEEPSFGPPEPPNGEWVDYIYLTQDGKQGYSGFKSAETWDRFKLKILDIEYTPAIKNSFK